MGRKQVLWPHTKTMEKSIIRINTRTLITVLVGFLWLVSACQQKHREEKIQNYFPQQVVVKSLEIVLLDKKNRKKLYSNNVFIQKNSLINHIESFKIGDFNVSMIDSIKVADALSKKSTVFEFQQFNIMSGGSLELTYVVQPGLYVKVNFEKKKDQWVVTDSQPYYAK